MPPTSGPTTSEVDGAALMRHAAAFARWVKLSGTAQEAESLGYVQQQLASLGFRTEMLEHPAYISLPGPASVVVGNQALRAITQSFSRPSPAGGLTAELADAGAADVRGRIALLDGIATPPAAMRATQAGAAGQIHISPHAHLHEMCISPVWGSPDSDALALLPQTVVCTISLEDGQKLRARLQAGERLEATLHAEVDTAWRPTPILRADMDAPGADGDAPFVLFSGHHDTWHYGVMDNGTANATMLELARVCARHRSEWRRGLRLCFWSGHSHGRFSGSTWYVDEHWDELDRRCVAHVNVDSPGARGATDLANTGAMSELGPLAAEAVWEQAGQSWTGARMPRGADMSFSGVGIPAIFGDLSEPLASPVMPHSPWWHTPEDLLNKIDEDLLVRDARTCLHGLWRLLTDPVLPLDYAAYADALLQELEALEARLAGRLSLLELIELARELRRSAAALPNGRDRTLMRLSRALVPIAYSRGDRFTHDPALPQPAWPSLQPIRALLEADPAAAQSQMVSATRARNRVAEALRQAIAELAGSPA